MAETDISIVNDDNGNSDHININIHRRALGEFLSGLLGQPRSTKKIFRNEFFIDTNFLYNLDHIIDQRVITQQTAIITDFLVNVYFSDDRIQTISSREDFFSFRDISNETTHAVEMYWTYLVQFPNRAAPEKQVIRFRASTDIPKLDGYDFFSNPMIYMRDYLFNFGESESQVSIDIDYTELTWGIDLLRYIEREVEKTIVYRNRILSQLRAICTFATVLFSFPAAFAVPVYAYRIARDASMDAVRTDISKVIEHTSDVQAMINEKLNYLMVQYDTSYSGFTLKFWILTISSYVVIAAIIVFLDQRGGSGLILNEATIRAVAAAKEKRARIRSSSFLAFVLGIVSSIVADRVGPMISAWL